MVAPKEMPQRLLKALRVQNDPTSLEAAAYIEAMLGELSTAQARRLRKQAALARDEAEAEAGRSYAMFAREALEVLRSEARRFDMPLEQYRGTKRGAFRWEGVYQCWVLAKKYGVKQCDLARFLRMSASTTTLIARRMNAARQISETSLASEPGSDLSGTHHYGVSITESDIHT